MKPVNRAVESLPTNRPIHVGRLSLSLRRGREVRIDGCALMRILHGSATLSVNASHVHIEAGMMLYLAFDMTVIAVKDSELDIEYISIDTAITGEIFFNITSSAFWGYLYSSPAFIPEPELSAYLDRWLRQAEWVQKRFQGKVADTVLRESVETLFIILSAEVEGRNPDTSLPKTRAWAIANGFVTLVHRHYARHHDVRYYADRLSISADYLNVVCRDNLGYTAKSRIDSQIVIAIKTLLDTTDLPVKSIAGRLCYDNPSYMCRMFRRITGHSPVEYRNRHQKK